MNKTPNLENNSAALQRQYPAIHFKLFWNAYFQNKYSGLKQSDLA